MREEGLGSLRGMPFKMILGPLRSLDCTLRTMNGCEATHAPEARNLMVKVRGSGGAWSPERLLQGAGLEALSCSTLNCSSVCGLRRPACLVSGLANCK